MSGVECVECVGGRRAFVVWCVCVRCACVERLPAWTYPADGFGWPGYSVGRNISSGRAFAISTICWPLPLPISSTVPSFRWPIWSAMKAVMVALFLSAALDLHK